MRSGVQFTLSLQKQSPQTKSDGLFSFWLLKACFHKGKREKDQRERSELGFVFVKQPTSQNHEAAG
jgi:hypothetical protein